MHRFSYERHTPQPRHIEDETRLLRRAALLASRELLVSRHGHDAISLPYAFCFLPELSLRLRFWYFY